VVWVRLIVLVLPAVAGLRSIFSHGNDGGADFASPGGARRCPASQN
jgi:hypothetical protein